MPQTMGGKSIPFHLSRAWQFSWRSPSMLQAQAMAVLSSCYHTHKTPFRSSLLEVIASMLLQGRAEQTQPQRSCSPSLSSLSIAGIRVAAYARSLNAVKNCCPTATATPMPTKSANLSSHKKAIRLNQASQRGWHCQRSMEGGLKGGGK